MPGGSPLKVPRGEALPADSHLAPGTTPCCEGQGGTLLSATPQRQGFSQTKAVALTGQHSGVGWAEAKGLL